VTAVIPHFGKEIVCFEEGVEVSSGSKAQKRIFSHSIGIRCEAQKSGNFNILQKLLKKLVQERSELCLLRAGVVRAAEERILDVAQLLHINIITSLMH
jgi:hypothetical protein